MGYWHLDCKDLYNCGVERIIIQILPLESCINDKRKNQIEQKASNISKNFLLGNSVIHYLNLNTETFLRLYITLIIPTKYLHYLKFGYANKTGATSNKNILRCYRKTHMNFMANPIIPQEEYLLNKLLTTKLSYFCLVRKFTPTVVPLK